MINTNFRINGEKQELYLKPCSKCKKKTKHRVFILSRYKGIKFSCLICNGKSRFMNFKKAKLLEIKE